jgi:hypothetical protein
MMGTSSQTVAKRSMKHNLWNSLLASIISVSVPVLRCFLMFQKTVTIRKSSYRLSSGYLIFRASHKISTRQPPAHYNGDAMTSECINLLIKFWEIC